MPHVLYKLADKKQIVDNFKQILDLNDWNSTFPSKNIKEFLDLAEKDHERDFEKFLVKFDYIRDQAKRLIRKKDDILLEY